MNGEPAEVRTYNILAIHPTTGAAYDIQLKASRQSGAIARTKLALMHRDQDAEWLRGSFTITEVK